MIQKDKSKRKIAGNHLPISCTPRLWKSLTEIIADKQIGLPEEQKCCRKNSSGTHNLLLIDKMLLLQELEMKKKNLFMT